MLQNQGKPRKQALIIEIVNKLAHFNIKEPITVNFEQSMNFKHHKVDSDAFIWII